MQNHLPDAGCGYRQEDDAGEKNRSQGCLPRYMQLDANGVGKVGIDAHAGGQGDGIARHHAHENRPKGRREAGRCGDRGQRHSGRRQDGRIHQHNIGHGQESRDAGQNLCAPVGPQARKFKIGFQSLEHRRVLVDKHTPNVS